MIINRHTPGYGKYILWPVYSQKNICFRIAWFFKGFFLLAMVFIFAMTQGAPTPVTALLSVGSKAAGFVVLIRLFCGIFVSWHVQGIMWDFPGVPVFWPALFCWRWYHWQACRFFGKFTLLMAAVKSGFVWLAFIGLLRCFNAAVNIIISMYYYLMVVKRMYADAPRAISPIPVSLPMRLLLGLAIAGMIGIGIFQGPFLEAAMTAAKGMYFILP